MHPSPACALARHKGLMECLLATWLARHCESLTRVVLETDPLMETVPRIECDIYFHPIVFSRLKDQEGL